MKKPIKILMFLLLFAACKKEPITDTNTLENNEKTTITKDEARQWLGSHKNDGILKEHDLDIQDSHEVNTPSHNAFLIDIQGAPTFQGIKQGYRQLEIFKDRTTKEIKGKFIEVIPEAIYYQEKGTIDQKDFTGRILEYDLEYKLQKGIIYAKGKPAGEIRPTTEEERKQFQNRPLPILTDQPTTGANGKIAMARAIEVCQWVQTSYIDSEGILNIHSERYCTTYMFESGSTSDDGGGGYYPPIDPPSGGGGGSTSNPPPSPPPPSNLPQEDAPKVDPKKMMDCFSNLSSTNAAFQVKVLVLEPQPGTSFNVGTNSFGHVAIQLTKASQGQVITQTIGFYPTGTGLEKLVSKSRMLDNGGLEYTMSSSFYTDVNSFQKVIDYISSPPENYHFTDFNCAAFVYRAGKAGNLPIPDPTTQIGISGPGGAGFAMTPAGMASALKAQKAANPNTDISDAGGRAPASKGQCN